VIKQSDKRKEPWSFACKGNAREEAEKQVN